MFVLISTGTGVMTSDASVSAFATHEEAHEVMEREILHWAKVVEEYDDDEMKSVVIEENEAYDENDPDSMTWNVFEVPGAFVPKTACDGFRKIIREAADMYGDEGRADWFDADDLCQQVCWELEGYLGKE